MKKLTILTISLLLVGCANSSMFRTTRAFNTLEFGMSKSEVQEHLGSPRSVSAKQLEGINREVWEYYADDWGSLSVRMYLIVFDNGKVVQWGTPEMLIPSDNEPETVNEFYNQTNVQVTTNSDAN